MAQYKQALSHLQYCNNTMHRTEHLSYDEKRARHHLIEICIDIAEEYGKEVEPFKNKKQLCPKCKGKREFTVFSECDNGLPSTIKCIKCNGTGRK